MDHDNEIGGRLFTGILDFNAVKYYSLGKLSNSKALGNLSQIYDSIEGVSSIWSTWENINMYPEWSTEQSSLSSSLNAFTLGGYSSYGYYPSTTFTLGGFDSSSSFFNDSYGGFDFDLDWDLDWSFDY